VNALELPKNIEAEETTLGATLLDPSAVLEVASWLTPAMFSVAKHQQIYAAELALLSRGQPVDIRTVHDELRRRGQLDGIGGFLYLNALQNTVPWSGHIAEYGAEVARCARLRAWVAGGERIVQAAMAPGADADELDALATSIALDATRAAGNDEMQSLGQVYDALYEKWASGQGPDAIPTGYRDVDQMLGGLHPEDLLILAARPGVGKTAMALSLAYNLGQRGQSVGVFSLEMGSEQLGQRLAAMHAKLDVHQLRQLRLSDRDMQRLVQAMSEMSEWPIKIYDKAGLAIATLQTRIMRHLMQHPRSVIVIDYLQLMTGGKMDNREQQIAQISRGLKQIARDAKVPVLALSQLSRAVEGRTSKVPMLADLRESGSLEQDADIVLFLYREELYDQNTEKKGVAELHIAKHRNGPVGVVPLRFNPSTTRFDDLTYRFQEVTGYAA
jgi:replicative DNA helicase